jgi:hypothetical protein
LHSGYDTSVKRLQQPHRLEAKDLGVWTNPIISTQQPQALQFYPCNERYLFVYWNSFIEKCFGGIRWTVNVECWGGDDSWAKGARGGIEDTIMHSVLLYPTSISVHKCHPPQEAEDDSLKNGTK